ncbi:MAG: hypothetical protein JO307_04580, partial [Bryobacterales bacterium]|nr:hypothetical protein [Bryobacterales bacterium]MBV9399670.1 hypothetical protein [Bryobacterales bacterium]
LGPLKLKRAYFHCAACGEGFCPRDRQLGLAGTWLSPAVTRMVAAVGAMVESVELWLARTLATWSAAGVVLAIAGVVLAIDLALVAAATARFQRSKLVLD